ncbi:MAG: hypothetical protein PHC88_00315 [Terrimicrobiaceae bacterium]|nr:hypothetical protein [Terrimicrobiaceae bacterium]
MKITLLTTIMVVLAIVPDIHAQSPTAESIFLTDAWKTTPVNLPGDWLKASAGKDWEMQTWKTPTMLFGQNPVMAQAMFRHGKLTCITITFADRFAYRTEEEKLLQAQLDTVNNTAPFDKAQAKQLASALIAARQKRDKEFSNGTGKALSAISESIRKALQHAFPDENYRLKYNTDGREQTAGPDFSGRAVFGDRNVSAVLDSQYASVTLYLFRQAPTIAESNTANTAEGDAAAVLLDPKIWDGSQSLFPKKIAEPLFGELALEIEPVGYFNPFAGGDVDRTAYLTVRYLRPFSGARSSAITPKSNALRRQFEKAKTLEEAQSLLTLEQATRKEEVAEALTAHFENARQYEQTILDHLRNHFPVGPENASPDAPFRFFRNGEFTALLKSTDEVNLEVFRRIEK